MWWSQLKSASIRFGFCVSNPSDSNLPCNHCCLCCSLKLSYNYMEKKSHATLVFVLVLLIITYYIHRHIFRTSKHWNHWTAIYRCLYILNTKSDDISQSHSAFNIIQTSRNSYTMCTCLLMCEKTNGKLSQILTTFEFAFEVPFWYRLTRVVPEKGPLNGLIA